MKKLLYMLVALSLSAHAMDNNKKGIDKKEHVDDILKEFKYDGKDVIKELFIDDEKSDQINSQEMAFQQKKQKNIIKKLCCRECLVS